MNHETQPSTTPELVNTPQTAADQPTLAQVGFLGVLESRAPSQAAEHPIAPSVSPAALETDSRNNQTAADQPTHPHAISQHNLAPVPLHSTLQWLWEQRLPTAGITLLDGDHGACKSLLALQLAALVSSGTRMLDNTTTLKSGVIIVSPHRHASASQLPRLAAMGANLSNIQILSSTHSPTPDSDTEHTRPFSLPEDLPLLLESIERANARLVIFDPFINLLSTNERWTSTRLFRLLSDLNQCLIERDIACLLIRNCPTKGGHARPSVLERSEYFLTTAVSRLLITHDPFQPDRLLLSHATNAHGTLAPTLTLELQPSASGNPNHPHFTSPAPHQLLARDFLDHRPDILHRRLLTQHLLSLITEANKTLHVSVLYAQSPHSSPFQVQRALSDLINMGQIERASRGFYRLAPANPVFKPKYNDEFQLDREDLQQMAALMRGDPVDERAVKSDFVRKFLYHDDYTHTNDEQHGPDHVKAYDGDNGPAENDELDADKRPVENDELDADNKLDPVAATTQTPSTEPVTEHDSPAATTPEPSPTTKLNSPAATTPEPSPATKLNSPAATTSEPSPTTKLNSPAATTTFNPSLPRSLDTIEPPPQIMHWIDTQLRSPAATPTINPAPPNTPTIIPPTDSVVTSLPPQIMRWIDKELNSPAATTTNSPNITVSTDSVVTSLPPEIMRWITQESP